MSLLEAVNRALSAVSLPPASSLEGSVAPHVALARRLVEEEDRATQHEGWHFNVEPDVTLPLEQDGTIEAPSNLVAFTPRGTDERQVSVRDGLFYDLEERSTTFTTALRGRLQVQLEFDICPPWFREYVAARAARRLQAQFRGDPAGARDAQAQEFQLLATARRQNELAARANTYRSETVYNVYGRRRNRRILG